MLALLKSVLARSNSVSARFNCVLPRHNSVSEPRNYVDEGLRFAVAWRETAAAGVKTRVPPGMTGLWGVGLISRRGAEGAEGEGGAKNVEGGTRDETGLHARRGGRARIPEFVVLPPAAQTQCINRVSIT